MTATLPSAHTSAPLPAPLSASSRARRRAAAGEDNRSVVSPADRRRPGVRAGMTGLWLIALGGLIAAAGLPLVWLLKASLSTTQEILSDPLGLPSRPHWENFVEAWTILRVGEYLLNTVWIVIGSVVATLIVCVTGAYVLSVLKPRWGPVLYWAVLITLFVPGVISLVPLYLTVVELPGTSISLLNTFWAIWLPAAAGAFNLVVMKRFFDGIPGELIDAARVDGAGPLRILLHIVTPLSKPVIGVIALLTAIGAYKEFLWPMLVLPEPVLQPISVALPRVDQQVSLSVQMAALLLTLSIPLALFLVFQRQFLRGVGMAGGIKG